MLPPRWQQARMLFSSGCRPPKRELWKEPLSPAAHYYGGYQTGGEAIFQAYHGCSLAPPHSVHHMKGNLNEDIYRYAVGETKLNGPYAQCRVCLTTINPITPGPHLHNGCTKLWNGALDKMTEEQKLKCFVCDEPTSNSRWALPLCVACVDVWKFYVARPAWMTVSLLEDLEEELNVGVLTILY